MAGLWAGLMTTAGTVPAAADDIADFYAKQ
jgi:hypothetical protein